MRELKLIADWRLLKELEKRVIQTEFFLNISSLVCLKEPLLEWVQSNGSAGSHKIVDERIFRCRAS